FRCAWCLQLRADVILVASRSPVTPTDATLSLHDALPIFEDEHGRLSHERAGDGDALLLPAREGDAALPHLRSIAFGEGFDVFVQDRKSTRLNSSHVSISYAVFCLKKKKLLIQLHVSDVSD